MSHAHSSPSVIKAQAAKIAKQLKALERGDSIHADIGGKVARKPDADGIKVGLAMDDKLIQMEFQWAYIKATSETDLTEFIAKQMRATRETKH